MCTRPSRNAPVLGDGADISIWFIGRDLPILTLTDSALQLIEQRDVTFCTRAPIDTQAAPILACWFDLPGDRVGDRLWLGSRRWHRTNGRDGCRRLHARRHRRRHSVRRRSYVDDRGNDGRNLSKTEGVDSIHARHNRWWSCTVLRHWTTRAYF